MSQTAEYAIQRAGTPIRFRAAKAYWLTVRILAGYLWLRLWRPILGPSLYNARLIERHRRTSKRLVAAILELKGLYIKVGQLIIDRAAHEVVVDGRSIVLTAKEFALLSFLAQNRGRVFSRETLLARVWGARYDGGPRTVDIHVRRLRMKLGDALPLETLRGAGYKLRTPGER